MQLAGLARGVLFALSLGFLAASALPVAGQLSRTARTVDLEKEEGVIEIYSPDSEFGDAVVSAGDVDGDGPDDILLAAPALDAVLLVYGQRGLPARFHPLHDNARLCRIEGATFKIPVVELGRGVDVNGDGLDDIFVGGLDRTAVIFGSAQLPAGFDLEDLGGAVPGIQIDFPRTLPRTGGYFAENTSLAADLNGDGIGEILLGDPHWPPGSEGMARAIAIFGGKDLPAFLDLELSYFYPQHYPDLYHHMHTETEQTYVKIYELINSTIKTE